MKSFQQKRGAQLMNEHPLRALPCPRIVYGQEQLTLEQEVYTRQFVQERIVTMLSCAPIDESEVEQETQARQAEF
jgi:hypothetical protein